MHCGHRGCRCVVVGSRVAVLLRLLAAVFFCPSCPVLRVIANDVPSFVSLHYSGEAEGPVSAYGFGMGQFGPESETMRFVDPHLTTARTQVGLGLARWVAALFWDN